MAEVDIDRQYLCISRPSITLGSQGICITDIDLGILPKYLELRPEAKIPKGFYNVASTGSEPFVTYLDWLTDMKKVTIYFEHENQEQAEKAEKAWKTFNLDNEIPRADRSKSRYLFRLKALEALKHVGLGFRGGLPALYKSIDITRNTAPSGERHFATTLIIVDDPEKARNYFNIGIHLPEIPTYPPTLEEAVDTYAKLCILVPNDMTIKELEKMNEEAKDEQETWALNRERFRLETKKKYRKVVTDMAHEIWLEDEVRCLLMFSTTTIFTNMKYSCVAFERRRGPGSIESETERHSLSRHRWNRWDTLDPGTRVKAVDGGLSAHKKVTIWSIFVRRDN